MNLSDVEKQIDSMFGGSQIEGSRRGELTVIAAKQNAGRSQLALPNDTQSQEKQHTELYGGRDDV